MKQNEKMLQRIINQKTLMHHIDRALETIEKFSNSHIEATRLPVHGVGAGQYIYLADLVAVRKALFNYADELSRLLDTTVEKAELEIK